MQDSLNVNIEDMNDLIKQRIEKLEKLRELNINPYPYKYEITHYSDDILNNSQKYIESEEIVSMAGRIKSYRDMGKSKFMHIEDAKGKIQVYFKKDVLGDEKFKLLDYLDLGDFIGVKGNVFLTKTGEITIKVLELEILTKAIRPLPVVKETEEKRFDEFADIEMKYRQRYVDLAVNPSVREVFKARSRIISTVRRVLQEEGFLEVETPTLQPIYGGASARPFITHHNTLDMKLFLRISPELYLKRLIVGGFEKVFDLSKNFRNEGIDRTHNPEFTMLECYQAYADFNDMMRLTEKIYQEAAKEIHGTTKVKYQGIELEFGGRWKEMKMIDALKELADIDVEKLSDEELIELAKKYEIEIDEKSCRGLIINELFEATCESKLVQPIFITHHPKETTPLCKQSRWDARYVERFEPFVNCWEIGNAYSELNDPILQRKLLEEQASLRKGEDAHPMDEDFVRAIEYGMPPTGGLGLGIDRMVMLLTDQTSIRDVILFPQMKPEKKN